MKKRMLKKAMALTLIFVISAACFVLPASAEEHWAKGYIARAQEKGWLAQAGIDPAFPPDGGITYESLIIMVCEAMGIKPWYSIDYLLHYLYEGRHPAIFGLEPDYAYKTFKDAQDTRMNEQGYLRLATQFGLLELSDYCDFPGGGFIAEDTRQRYPEKSLEPYRAALRGDAVMLITRGLGLVKPAGERDVSAALYSDWDAVPDWEKGCAGELYDADVLTADLNGAARVGDPISLGEACQMVCAAYDYMTEGIDESVCVECTSSNPANDYSMLAWLPVPVQIVNGLIYIPIRSYYQTGIDFDYHNTIPETFQWAYWEKRSQCLIVPYLDGYEYYYYPGQQEYRRRSNRRTALGPVRLLFGEVMFPIMTVDDERFYDGVVHIEVESPMVMSS